MKILASALFTAGLLGMASTAQALPAAPTTNAIAADVTPKITSATAPTNTANGNSTRRGDSASLRSSSGRQPIFAAFLNPSAVIEITGPGMAGLRVPGNQGISRVYAACA